MTIWEIVVVIDKTNQVKYVNDSWFVGDFQWEAWLRMVVDDNGDVDISGHNLLCDGDNDNSYTTVIEQ